MGNYSSNVGSVLISKERIQERVKDIAQKINEDYKDKDNVVILGVLKGAFVFLADLIREISLDIRVEFISVSSYVNSESTGKFYLKIPCTGNLEGANVIIVEDIIDSGLTIEYLLDVLKNQKVKSARICCLFSKKIRREKEVDIDYVGFDIGDDFIIGYGLDYNGKFRNIPFIATYKDDKNL